GVGLLDACHRETDIGVPLESGGDELVELRVVVELPPVGPEYGRSDVLLGVSRRQLHRGPLVVRSDRAAREQEGAGEGKLARAHDLVSCAASSALRALRLVRKM